jgi:AbrB family looped-hinge helix DNA binding protein
MKEHVSVITRKGQVTIPAEIRRALSLNEGDMIAFEVEDDRIHIAARRSSVVHRTAGALRSKAPMLSPEEEWKAVEQAIAEDVVEHLRG